MTDNEHDPQPVSVTRYPLVDDVAAELGITADEVLAKLPPYEFVGHNPEGLRISPAGAAEVRAAVTDGPRPVPCRDRGDGVCVSCGQRVGGPCARPTFVHGDDGFLRDADPPPPSLADRSLAAISASRTPQADSAGAVSAHLKARRAVEDMAAAHREQLAGARAATRKAADEAERWRVEAEAARAQVGTLTAERDEAWRNALRHREDADRLREALEGLLEIAPPDDSITRQAGEALGGTP